MDAGLRAAEGLVRGLSRAGACLVQAVCLVKAVGLVQVGMKLVTADK